LTRIAYAGVDVAFARGKRLPVSVCVHGEHGLEPLPLRQFPFEPPKGMGNALAVDREAVTRFALESVKYLQRIERHVDVEIVRVAIDAPSSPCSPGLTRRACERAMDSLGVSCIATPDGAAFDRIREKVLDHLGRGGAISRVPHANQLWMFVGFELFRAFRALRPIEVYPQAIAFALNSAKVHKSKGATDQLLAAARYTGWPNSRSPVRIEHIGWGAVHDRVDAYLSAWVASVDECNRFPFGQSPDDVIWVPGNLHSVLESPDCRFGYSLGSRTSATARRSPADDQVR
jgi:hypothetical protein